MLRFADCWYNVTFSSLAHFLLQAQPITLQIVLYFKIASFMAVQTHNSTGVSDKFLASAIFRLNFRWLKDVTVTSRSFQMLVSLPIYQAVRRHVPKYLRIYCDVPSVSNCVSYRPLFRRSAVVSICTTYLNMKNLPFFRNGVCVCVIPNNKLLLFLYVPVLCFIFSLMMAQWAETCRRMFNCKYWLPTYVVFIDWLN